MLLFVLEKKRKKVHVLAKKKERKKVHVLGKKKKVHALEKRKKKKVENANSGKRGFGMRIQTHT